MSVNTTQKDIPWKLILTTPAVWAIIINNFTSELKMNLMNLYLFILDNWGFYIILTWLPTYLEEELHFDLHENTAISFLPYLAQFVGTLSVGRLADFLIQKVIQKKNFYKKLII
jgi:sugar phosphate permease